MFEFPSLTPLVMSQQRTQTQAEQIAQSQKRALRRELAQRASEQQLDLLHSAASSARMIPRSSPNALAKVGTFEAWLAELPQIELRTEHVIHAGMYSRTITIPPGAAVTSALIKRATLLIVVGDVTLTDGAAPMRLTGHNTLPASAGRKSAWFAHQETRLTMIFPTSARTVEEAEREFTDDVSTLMSRHNANDILITEE